MFHVACFDSFLSSLFPISLLLLAVGFFSFPGYCSVPVLVENIVLSDAALLLNKFPNNTVIPLECANGYVKDKGPGTMKCMDETWSEPALTCKSDCFPKKFLHAIDLLPFTS